MGNDDVIVIGAGAAGSSAAFTLARSGARVRVIDGLARMPALKIGESLSGQGVALLNRAGLLEWAMTSAPLENPGNLSCWGSDALEVRDFLNDREGCGWHLDRAVFDAALRQAATAEGAMLHDGHVREIERIEEGGWRVHVGGACLRARWLVDASGRKGIVARRLGVPRVRDRPLIAVHSWGPDRCADARTVVEATSSGWWYTAPIPGGRRVCALHTSPGMARRLTGALRAFADAMQDTLHIKAICRPGDGWLSPRAVDASGSCLATSYGKDWMAIGDAAMTFDPLSAHGLLNALAHGFFGAAALLQHGDGSGDSLATLDTAIKHKRKSYTHELTELYENEHRFDNLFYKDQKNARKHHQ